MTCNANIVNATALYSKGGTGAGTNTHFPYSDGNNYIGGNTNMSNNLSVGGTVTAGALKANGNITIGNTTINESHLQMLTGQADFLIEHTRRRKGNNNTDPNQGPSRYLHSGDNGVISRYKDENASFFKLVKE